jgi:hypothetical protein
MPKKGLALNWWDLLTFIIFAAALFLAMDLAEGIHNLWKDVGVSIVISIVTGFVVTPVMKRARA